MSNNWLNVVAGLTIVALLFNSCCKCDDPNNPECPNYTPDPCDGAEPWSAEFTMHHQLSSDIEWYLQDPIYDHDSVWHNKVLICEAVYLEADSFHWQLEGDPQIHTGPVLTIEFNQSYPEVNITLVVFGKAETCFPSEATVKSVTKTIHLVERWELPIWGKKYSGAFTDDPNTVLTAEFYFENLQNEPVPGADFIIGGVPAGCEGVLLMQFSHRRFWIDVTSAPCGVGIGMPSYAFVSEDFNQLTLYIVSSQQTRIFHGNKV